jgi:hypothetical protein
MSAFRDLRLAAGFELAQIAKAANVNRGTVWRWDCGDRPRWKFMPQLAEFFGIELVEAVKQLWGETIGDPCPCGCSGRKSAPANTNAFVLSVDVPCISCGKLRKYHRSHEHFHKRILCNRCTAAKRKLKRISFKCEGDSFHLSHRGATNCPREIKILRSRIKHWGRCIHCAGRRPCKCGKNEIRTIDDGQHPFLNEAEGKFRCQRCWHAGQIFKAVESDLRNFWRRVRPHAPLPNIRRIPQLRAFQKRCYRLARAQNFGRSEKSFAYNPALLNSKRTYKPGPRERNVNHIMGSLAWRAKTSPYAYVKGLCLICDKLIFSYRKTRIPKTHLKCLQSYQRKHHQSKITLVKPRKRGGQLTTEGLAKHWSWAMRYYAGESPSEIGGGITSQSVHEAVQEILKYRPAPDLVLPEFRNRLSLLNEIIAKNGPISA